MDSDGGDATVELFFLFPKVRGPIGLLDGPNSASQKIAMKLLRRIPCYRPVLIIISDPWHWKLPCQLGASLVRKPCQCAHGSWGQGILPWSS